MNVQLAVHTFYPESSGGTELYVLQLAKSLARAGHAAHVLAGTPPAGRMVASSDWEGIPVTRLACPADTDNPIRDAYDNATVGEALRALWRDRRPDVLHVCHPGNLSTAILTVAAEMGVPTVVTLTDFWPICPASTLYRSDGALCSGPGDLGRCARCYASMGPRGTRYRSGVQRIPTALLHWAAAACGQVSLARPRAVAWLGALARRTAVVRARLLAADALICLSAFQRQTLARWGYPLAAMRRLPHGTATPAMAVARSVPSREKGLAFGYIGPLSAHKGAHLPIEAFARLRPGRRARLMYWGAIPAPPDEYASRVLQRLEETTNATHRGAFAPGDLPAVMGEIDVLIVPSVWYENTPMVIYEALAHRVPVIATSIGGMRELVTEHHAGWLFARGAVEDLTAVMQARLDDPSSVAAASAAAGPAPEFEAHAREVEALCRRLVEEGRDA